MTFKRRYFGIITLLYVLCTLLFVDESKKTIYYLVDALFLFSAFFDALIRPKKFLISLMENYYAGTLAIFSVYIILSFIWSPNNFEMMVTNILQQSSLVLNAFALYYIAKQYRLLNYMLSAFVIFVFVNIGILVNLFSNSFFSGQPSFIADRFVGTSTNANAFAVCLVFSCFSLLLLIKNKKSSIISFICVIALMLAFYQILLSASKEGLIGYLIVLFLFIYFDTYRNYKRKLGYLTFGVLAIIAIVFIGGDFLIGSAQDITKRFSGLYNFFTVGSGDFSTVQRFYFLKLGLNEFMNHPIIGHGQQAFQFYYTDYSHNNYIELLFNLGLIGFALYYWIYYRAFKSAAKIPVKIKGWVFAILITMLFLDFTIVSYNLRFFMTMFVLIELISKQDNSQLTFIQRSGKAKKANRMLITVVSSEAL